jgi:uncharacterized protein (DUF58 family)
MSIPVVPTQGGWLFSWREILSSIAAVLALGLALGAALASSVAAQAGSTATALALAALSLLLAAVIALTVVPRLFRKARQEWLHFAFTITRVGWFYIATLLVLAVSALNTGNNLMFIIFSAGLSTLIVSELLSRMNLMGIQFRMDSPGIVHAKKPFLSVLSLHNSKRWIPSFSLSVETFNTLVSTKLLAEPSIRESVSTQNRQFYFPFVPTGAHPRMRVQTQLVRRGRYRQQQVEIMTQFPFGFVKKKKRLPAPQEIIVLPEIDPPNEFFEALPLLNGAFESYYRGRGSDLYSIRAYSNGDNARLLDWKSSAKTGELKVREFTREDDRKCCFVFDNYFSRFDETDRPAFENAVKLCANVARHFHEIGGDIRLVTSDVSTPFSKSGEGLLGILKVLAVIEPLVGEVQPISELASDLAFKILFTSHPRGAIPTLVWHSSHVIFIRES